MKWLNAAGIILNFISAFLIAPELIGINRIRRLEKDIENILFEFMESIYRFQKGIKPYLGLFDKRSGLSLLFWLLLEYLTTLLIIFSSKSTYGWILLLFMFLLLYLQSLLWISKVDIGKTIKIKLIKMVIAVFTASLFLVFVFFSPIFLTIVLVIQVFGKIALWYSNIVLKILVGENSLRTAIIIIGIILFVIGNILQFIASF